MRVGPFYQETLQIHAPSIYLSVPNALFRSIYILCTTSKWARTKVYLERQLYQDCLGNE